MMGGGWNTISLGLGVPTLVEVWATVRAPDVVRQTLGIDEPTNCTVKGSRLDSCQLRIAPLLSCETGKAFNVPCAWN